MKALWIQEVGHCCDYSLEGHIQHAPLPTQTLHLTPRLSSIYRPLPQLLPAFCVLSGLFITGVPL